MAVLPSSLNSGTSSADPPVFIILVTGQSDKKSEKLDAASIAGIVISVVVLIASAAVVVYFWRVWHLRKEAFATAQTTYVAAPRKQLSFKQTLRIDSRALLRDLSSYLAGQTSLSTVAPVIVRETILKNDTVVNGIYSRGSSFLRPYVHPRDVELGPNPVIEAHIVQALREQEQAPPALNSQSSQQTIEKLEVSKEMLARWQATSRVWKSGDPFSPRRSKISLDRKKQIWAHQLEALGNIEEEDGDISLGNASDNPHSQGATRDNRDLDTILSRTISLDESTILTSAGITPQSSLSTPSGGNLPDNCSATSEEIRDDGDLQPDPPIVKSVVDSPPLVMFPVHVEYTHPVGQARICLPSIPEPFHSSPTAVSPEVDCKVSPSPALTPIPTTPFQDGKATNLSFACRDCPLQFDTAGQMRNHYNRKHNRRYACKICSAWFNLRGDLLRHEQTVHRDAFPSTEGFQCTNAGCTVPNKIFGRKDNFRRHLRQCRPTLAKKDKSVDSDVGLT